MDTVKLPHTAIFLNEIRSFRKRERLSECWEILWRKWNTQLINEYFMDNHINEIDRLMTCVTKELYSNAKIEIINEFDKVSSKPNVNEILYHEVITEIKNVIELYNHKNLYEYIVELNKEIIQGKVILNPPRFVQRKYDTSDESQWIQTQKPDIIDTDEIEYFLSMINPILLALENLLLITEMSAKRTKKELESLLNGIPTNEHNVLTLPSLLRSCLKTSN